MNRFVTLIFIFNFSFFFISSSAQNDVADVIKRINAIKRDTNIYLYAESTTSTWEEAYDNAKALLEANIEDWARNEKSLTDASGCIAKADNSLFEIKTRRGNLYRAFLYVKKADILSYSTTKEIVVVPMNQNDENKSESKIQDFEKKNNKTNDDQKTIIDPQSTVDLIYRPSLVEQEIMNITQFSDIAEFIKGNERVANYGKYSTIPAQGECFLYVYNRQGGISAYLKRTTSGYVNMKTGDYDSLENYKGCGAIWFTYE